MTQGMEIWHYAIYLIPFRVLVVRRGVYIFGLRRFNDYDLKAKNVRLLLVKLVFYLTFLFIIYALIIDHLIFLL